MHIYNTYNAYIHTHQVNKYMMIKLYSDKCYENPINQNKMIVKVVLFYMRWSGKASLTT